MQLKFKITVGETEIEITGAAESHQDFVKTLSFFTTIPTKGPNGETDLKFVHRKTQQGHEYYSLISDQAGKEFKFGQSQQEPGTLFCKDWEDKFVTEGEGAVGGGLGQQTSTNNAPANNAPANNGLGNQVNNAPVNNAPVNNGLGNQLNNVPANNAPVNNAPANNAPANNGLGNQLGGIGTQLNNINTAPANNAPANNGNAAVNDVLAKYGINSN